MYRIYWYVHTQHRIIAELDLLQGAAECASESTWWRRRTRGRWSPSSSSTSSFQPSTSSPMSGEGMALILDGNSELVAHVWRKKSNFWHDLHSIKCLKQIKLQRLLLTSRTYFWVTIKCKYHGLGKGGGDGFWVKITNELAGKKEGGKEELENCIINGLKRTKNSSFWVIYSTFIFRLALPAAFVFVGEKNPS